MPNRYFESRWAFLVLPAAAVATFSTSSPDGAEVLVQRSPDLSRECLLAEVDEGEVDAAPGHSAVLAVQFGDDIPAPVQERIESHLESASFTVELLPPDAAVGEAADGALVLSFGDTTGSHTLIETGALDEVGPEGFVLRSGTIGETRVVATNGAGLGRADVADVGALYGAYALLEELGFAFLHPLEPVVPREGAPRRTVDVDRVTSPRWPVRGLQLHTMHPLELTDMLQGWGPKGPDDHEGWLEMLDEWDTFLEWMVANGQNRVHWVWLRADSWHGFAVSTERIERVRRLVERAHEFGIEVGLDVPLRLQQQNSARLIHSDGTLEDEVRQIREGVAHVMQADFDYLVTEAGSTEFTAVEDRRMVAWMDAMTAAAEDEHGVSVFIKVHASTGQGAPNFLDAATGEPLNFNFLPHHADERLGVLPHTVQHYALDDPAPTYGNRDFGHIREFLRKEAGRRPTVWHPETAYWVSFDNDVPLFLPVYASRRVRDLRLLAGDEEAGRMGVGEHAGSRMDGQMTFSSGWEWGYWLQEVVTARAAWDPKIELETDEAALRAHLRPVARPFGDTGDALVDWILDYTRLQQELFIEGKVAGKAPRDVERRNGQAYLQGWETWDDVSDLLADRLGLTHGRMQPDRVSFADLRRGAVTTTTFREEVAPLLEAMERELAALVERGEALGTSVPRHVLHLYEELLDSARVTALRAKQIRALYDYVLAQVVKASDEEVEQYLAEARDALDAALAVVAHREEHYRVPADRIAAWRKNPTVYPFTYLWTVRSLYYWQRDEARAILRSEGACLFNIIDPVDVGLGDGGVSVLVDRLADRLAVLPAFRSQAACMRAPSVEPPFLHVSWRTRDSR